MANTDRGIGFVLFGLPIILFIAMIWYWPSPGGPALENWHKATRGVVAFEQQLSIENAKLKVITDTPVPASEDEKKKRADAITSAQAAVAEADRKFNEAKTRQGEAYKAVAAASTDAAGINLSEEAHLCILVVLAGALGASVSAARGFAFHLGNKDYDIAWRWWYLLRIPTGCGIAFILYAVLRAGLVPWKLDDASSTLSHVNPYGFVAIGALGGMFANEAFQKLQTVLAAILSSGANSAAPAPRPEIKAVKFTQQGDRKAITITGQNFRKGASVKVNNETWTVDPKDVSETEVKAKGAVDIPAGKVAIELTIPGPPPQTAKWNEAVSE